MSTLVRTCVCVVGIAFGGLAVLAAEAAPVTGNLTYKGRSAALKHAWLVTGPSDMEPGKTVRRLVLSTTDVGAKLEACKTFSCTDGAIMEGATVDFTGGPRLNYWTVMDGQKVQYSGTARTEAFSLRSNDPGRLAGSLAIDDTAAGGAELDAGFDLTVLKEFKVAR
jgi:hypothetical protein